MSKNSKNQKKPKAYDVAVEQAKHHYLLGRVARNLTFHAVEAGDSLFNLNEGFYKGSLLCANFSHYSGHIYFNKNLKLSEQEWLFVFCVLAIILGMDLYKKLQPTDISHEIAVTLFAVNYVYEILGLKDVPECWNEVFSVREEISFKNETSVYEQLANRPELASKVEKFTFLLAHASALCYGNKENYFRYGGSPTHTFSEIFTTNLVEQAQKTILLKSQQSYSEEELKKRDTLSFKAKQWFVTHYPLLSSLASTFDVIEDIEVAKRLDVEIGAVNAAEKVIIINPLANLNEQGMRFVIAHEILHVALDHQRRRMGRDAYMWNLANDFIINHWLVEMGIGIPPDNIYLDKSLAGKSSDEIYLMIAQDVRLKKKMGTLKNTESGANGTTRDCDMLGDDPRYFAEFADACKSALLRGMFLHQSLGRGLLPADLEEEIRAINQPPIPWQVELAQWIAEKFPLEESKRTYSRPSRRQSSTPDIARARYVRPDDEKNTRTFGVVMDTSASMDRKLLAQCLGAVASYSAAQEVKYIRLVFCDAQPYDEGYVSVDSLSQKVMVKGRGGTQLQPAINYLENAQDFPDDAPILILTDGWIEEDLSVKREHAYLVPNRLYLPFMPKGKVFEFKR